MFQYAVHILQCSRTFTLLMDPTQSSHLLFNFPSSSILKLEIHFHINFILLARPGTRSKYIFVEWKHSHVSAAFLIKHFTLLY